MHRLAGAQSNLEMRWICGEVGVVWKWRITLLLRLEHLGPLFLLGTQSSK